MVLELGAETKEQGEEKREIVFKTKKNFLNVLTTNIFIDREHHIKIFKKIVDAPKQSNKIAYCFYGVEGIGKTSLCNRFLKMLKGQKDIVSVKIDLENKEFLDALAFLFEIRRQITEKEPKFKFKVFDITFEHYWNNVHPHIAIKEKAKKSPILSAIKKSFKIGKKNFKRTKTANINQSQPFLKNFMQTEETRDVEESLANALIMDLKTNLSERNKRLFVFVDTFEAIWGEDKEQTIENSILDRWLRKTIKYAINECQNQITWFLFSRDRICWEKVEEDLKNYVEQHLIEELSVEDCRRFLNESGITETKIQEKIIEVSKGVPFYLERAIELYYNIIETEKRTPTLEDFPVGGEEELIQCYLRNCKEEDRTLIKLLSVPRIWNKKLFHYLVKELNLAIPFTDFKRFIQHSFVQQLMENQYSLHKVFIEHIYSYYTKQNANEVKTINKKVAEYYSPLIDFSSVEELSPRKLRYLSEWLYHMLYLNPEEAIDKCLSITELLFISGYHHFLYIQLNRFLSLSLIKKNTKRRILYNIGLILNFWENHSQALEYFKQALDITREIEDKKGEGTILNNIGSVLQSQGEYDQALEYFKQALDITRKIEDKRGERRALSSIDSIFDSWGGYEKALEYLLVSSKIAEKLGTKKREEEILTKIGLVFQMQEEYDKALDYFHQAIEITEKIGDKEREKIIRDYIEIILDSWGGYEKALKHLWGTLKNRKKSRSKASKDEILSNLGLVFQIRGQYGRALEFYLQALESPWLLGDGKREKTIIGYINSLLNSWGGYEKAFEYLQQELKNAKKIYYKKRELETLNCIGSLYRIRKKVFEAQIYYTQALQIAQEIRDKEGERRVSNNLGLILYTTLSKIIEFNQNIDQNIQRILNETKALTIAEESEDSLKKKEVLNNIGVELQNLGEYDKALEYYKQALDLAQKLGDKEGEGRTLGNIGSVFKMQERYGKALEYLERAAKIAQEIEDKNGIVIILSHLASTFIIIGEYDKALEYYKQALEFASETGKNNEKAIILFHLGIIFQLIGSYDEALEYYEQSLNLAQKLGVREGEGRTLGMRGYIYFNLGEFEKALTSFNESLKIYEDLGLYDDVAILKSLIKLTKEKVNNKTRSKQ
ncbi:MAG: tetratricopeptide repeat protein [Candidatus Heimdallarchaeaceae archaeon]